MAARVYQRQGVDRVVDLTSWTPHEEFDPFAPGSKPKGLHYCPQGIEEEFLLSGHLYMFKSGDDWRARQFWSEVIAYELSKLCGVDVPPAFVAYHPENGTHGCLSEIFLGYQGDRFAARLIHGSDLIRRPGRYYDEKNGRPHTYRNNVRICRTFGVKGVEWQWCQILVFDALIGNTDRHPENWGLLRYLSEGAECHRMAPVYDNGTSLGYGIQEDALVAARTEVRLAKYMSRGTHHVQFEPPDKKGGDHVGVCRRFVEEYPESRDAIKYTLGFDLEGVRDILSWCCEFAVEPRFSRERADFIWNFISRRKAELESLI